MILSKKRQKLVVIIIAAILLLLSLLFFEYNRHGHILLKEVNVEAGNKDLMVGNLYKNGNKRSDSKILTDLSAIDFNTVGDVSLDVMDNGEKKTVLVHIVDTQPPRVKFKNVSAGLSYKIKGQDFVESVEDASRTTITVDEPNIDKFGSYNVKVTVTDTYNNSVSQICKLTIALLVPEYNLELGNKITKEDVVFDKSDAKYVDDKSIEEVNSASVGSYLVKALVDDQEFTSKVIITDTKAPELKVKDATKYVGEKVTKDDFIEKVYDASNNVTTSLIGTYNAGTVGKYDLSIEAIDSSNNKATAKVVLTIKKDDDAPTFSGLKNISVKQNQKIDYKKGVSAVDKKDGKVDFTVDSSKVDTSKSGTYYAFYTAKDKSGNKATVKRKIVVKEGEKSLEELLDYHASKAGKNYKDIRKYVQQTIKYSKNWGGKNPVYYGLTHKAGNCYVHALIYQELLKRAGYETMLIWTTDKTHYWNLIKLNGVWRHTDSTPGNKHTMIVNETDVVRYEHLQGRDWDRSKWPAAK